MCGEALGRLEELGRFSLDGMAVRNNGDTGNMTEYTERWLAAVTRA
jgi:hypothetical protein